MKRTILAGALALVSGVTGLMAQQKQPQPKSQKEVEALQAMFGAQDPDARIKAAEELLTKFADTEFKSVAMYLLAASYEQKNDFPKMTVWAEKTLEADPKNFATMMMLASGIVKNAKEHDLDLEEKLGRAEKYTKSAVEILAFAGVFAVVFAFTGSPFVLGGALGCTFLSAQHWKFARRQAARPQAI